MKPYFHQIQYYETDKMGITNNTNYVRFMEEARNDYLSKMGYPYAEFEKRGIISPVVQIKCEYRRTTTYPDIIKIIVRIAKVNKFKLKVSYLMKVKGKVVCKASSEHCFMDRHRQIVNIKRQLPHFFKKLKELEIKK